MESVFQNPVAPFPGWMRRLYRLSRPVTDEDIRAFLGNEELYVRDTGTATINIIHKYGMIEIHCIAGEPGIEVWFDPEYGAYPLEYLEALISTRF